MSTQRRIFVGDIQGCRVELEQLLERLRFDPAADVLHPVGDFVNRGPDSAGVLRVCRSLGAGGVLGNHDMLLLRVARGEREWRPRDTAQDVLAAPDGAQLLDWLGARPLVRAFEDVLCVHAGINPAWKDPVAALARLDPLREEQDLSFAISARYCDAQGARPPKDWPAPALPFRPWHAFWSERARETRTVVYGHWARAGLNLGPRVRGLDSGCVWGGKLSAWIAEEDRIVQVPAARAYADYED
ncbi:MAG: metallophosphoesterase [Planctomycetes bacterium]|nr:metallophosphoesterase [Planctomycetota bacterium]